MNTIHNMPYKSRLKQIGELSDHQVLELMDTLVQEAYATGYMESGPTKCANCGTQSFSAVGTTALNARLFSKDKGLLL